MSVFRPLSCFLQFILTISPVGATIGGRLADRAVIEGRLRREGEWVPEDRLRATLFGALILLPLSVLIFGLTTQFVPGKFGLMIDIVCVFMNGVGVCTRLSEILLAFLYLT
jgi:hypothetical protein